MSNFKFPELKNHIWEFSYIGGIPRVQLKSAQDIQALEHLDPKLWAALSCPVNGLEFDSETLKKMDFDGDEFIRIPDVIKSVYWTLDRIKNPKDLTELHDKLPLSAIQDVFINGKNLYESAKQVLINLGKNNEQSLTKADTSDITKIFANTKFNGDGVITEDSTDDLELKSLIVVILKMASVVDKNGKPGIDLNITDQFYQACENYSSWQKNKKTPFNENTVACYELYLKLKNKIEDYFLRCQLTEFDTDSIHHLQVSQAQFLQLGSKNIYESIHELELFPLAKVQNNQKLSLETGINPAWIDQMNEFNQKVIQILFPKAIEIDYFNWLKIKAVFSEYELWLSNKNGSEVEFLSLEIIEKILANNQKEKIVQLIAKDKEFEDESNAIDDLDTLVRYYQDIPVLLRNFVNFNDFYDPELPAIFQSGQLYIDERCCDLCVIVQDMSRQDLMASSGNVCLLYCDCFSKSKAQKMTIVAALTDGSLDNITVGRNGVFVDKNGEDWSATVIKIIEHPISIREAFWSPYKKVSKFISSQIEKFATSKSQEIEASATSSVERTTGKIETGLKESLEKKEVKVEQVAKNEEPKVAPFDIGKFVGIFAAISLALGALGSILMNFLTGFFALKWWQMPIAMTGLILTISLPSMVLAYLKIRKRNFAPILDANGWAINSSIKINMLFGRALTHLAKLPNNAKLNLNDPFTKKNALALPVLLLLGISIAVLVFYAFKNGWIPKFDWLKAK